MKKLLQNNLVMLLLALCLTSAANAQWQNGLWTGKQANNWYLYNNTGLNFDTTPPTVLTDGQLFTLVDYLYWGPIETTATISDANGNLLFYVGTNAVLNGRLVIWNKNHQYMHNTSELSSIDISATQGTLIIQKPGNPDVYYVITMSGDLHAVQYSEVDLTLDGGLGGVTENRNVKLIATDGDSHNNDALFLINDGSHWITEKLAAIYHPDGKSIWLATASERKLYTFLITEDGISAQPQISDLPFDNYGTYAGQMKFSPDGSKIAFAHTGYPFDPVAPPRVPRTEFKSLEIFNFDTATGKITTPIANIENGLVITDPIGTYGLEFSPNSKYLYTVSPIENKMFQFDLTLSNQQAIINSATLLFEGSLENVTFKDLQLSREGKIYMGNNSDPASLHVINNPNNGGIAAGFEENGQAIAGNMNNTALPNFIANYFQSGILYTGQCDGDATAFSTIRIPDITSIAWNFGDTASGAANTSTEFAPSHTFSTPGTYTVTATIISNGATQTATQEVTIYPLPNAVPQALAVCSNGSGVFNLNGLNAGILNGQDAATFTVTYYASEADLQANNPIATPDNFTTTGQVVYVQVVNNITGCKTAIQFNLSVNPLPRAAAPASLTKCGTPAGTASFNLTSQDTAILNGQDAAGFVVNYFSDADAQNVITTPESFTSAGQVVYAVVSNTATGCTSNIISFNLEVTEASFFTEALQFTGCPPYNLDGIVTGLEEGLTLTYFASQQEAENNSNAIANPDMYNTSAKEILLYVRAQNADGCIDVTQLVLQQDDCSIPKGISPNGDNKNDRFELSALNVAYLGIYNRFGQEVYSQSNYTNQWHGQTSNNNELPTGTYYFMVQRADGRSETGWVYINREE